jgi:hypothetical protein
MYIYGVFKKQINTMKVTFELQNWMSENREIVISKYNDLTNEAFFNGISLKDFMIQIMRSMTINDPKSDKRAASLLPFVVGNVYVNNCKIQVVNDLDANQADKYRGTAFMAMV